MKKARKFLSLALCAVLLVTATVAGTLAYLTANAGTVTNTFSVGNIKFDEDSALDEAQVDIYGEPVSPAKRVTENKYKLIPGQSYTKDPTVHLAAGNEDCYIFIEVKNGISAIEADTNTIASQIAGNAWIQYKDANGNAVAGVYYKELTAAEMTTAKDLVVFSSFTLADDADVNDETADYANKNITIKACAVQKAGVDLATAYGEANKMFTTATTQP